MSAAKPRGRRSIDAGIVILVASVAAGALNYVYALGMSALLSPRDYSAFASGNALLLVAGTVANAAIPWLLAREIARDPGAAGRGTVRFAVTANLAVGMVAAIVVSVLAVGFGDVWLILWVGASTLSFFVASTGMGWAQGHQRFGLLATLILAEVGLKAAVGAGLVLAGFGAAGAFAGAVVGAVVITIAMLGRMRPDMGRSAVRFPRDLVRSAAGMAGVQAAVSALAVVDVIAITIVLGTSSEVAAYQLAATLSRVPLFVAAALSTAAFPALAQRPGDREVLTRQAAGLGVLLLPILIVIATAPSSVLGIVISDEYATADGYLAVTAATGTAWAIVTFQTTALRADARFAACVRPLAIGAVVSMVAMLAGASVADVRGLAYGALAGGVVTVVAFAVVMRQLWPATVQPRLAPLLVSVPACIALVLARDHALAWMLLAALFSIYCGRVWLTGAAVPHAIRSVVPA